MFKSSAIACAVATFLAIGTGAAFAHVTLETQTAAVGSTYKAVLRVPHGCEGKATIAGLARDLVKEGDSIYIGEGTTTLALARLLADHVPCKFTTNMMDIGIALGRGRGHEIFITGGRLYPEHGILAGHAAIMAAQSEIYDIAFVGTSSITLNIGFLDHERVLAEINKALTNRARRLVVLADHSKFGASARFVTYDLSAVDTVVTDSQPGKAYLDALYAANVEVICP